MQPLFGVPGVGAKSMVQGAWFLMYLMALRFLLAVSVGTSRA